MRVLWNIRSYPPQMCRGAEMYAHEVNKHLLKSGHEVLVMIERCEPFDYEGVSVVEYDRNIYKDWDIVFTHLEATDATIFDCRKADKPCVFVAHNTFDYPMVRRHENVGVILNCKEAETLDLFGAPTRKRMVLPPPVDIDYYRTTPGHSYTLINLCENKGSKTFYEIAKLMPEKHFIGVKGAYNNQINTELPNVQIWPGTSEIKRVYWQTRILLMPSRYESWGRTATEAMASGIPVICTPTFGLKENCADAAYYCDRNNPEQWVAAIKEIEANYAEWSAKASARAEKLRPDYTEFDLFLLKMTT